MPQLTARRSSSSRSVEFPIRLDGFVRDFGNAERGLEGAIHPSVLFALFDAPGGDVGGINRGRSRHDGLLTGLKGEVWSFFQETSHFRVRSAIDHQE